MLFVHMLNVHIEDNEYTQGICSSTFLEDDFPKSFSNPSTHPSIHPS